MKTLYLECKMGAAGDMLTAALLELLPDPDAFLKKLNGLGIPGVEYRREKTAKCGVAGTHISVLVHGEEEGHHQVEGHHRHHHSSPDRIEEIVKSLALPEKVRRDVLAVYGKIAQAESRVHGVPVSDIHFHEVGTMDAVADVTAVCLLMNELAPDEVVASPIHVGSGLVQCAHGILPVPAPATALLLEGIPTYGGTIEAELCTPTGAALLAYFTGCFGPMPLMKAEKIGYGFGKKDFPAANCVRAFFGESGEEKTDEVLELSCNVDDMTAEEIGFAVERLFEGGAREVYTVPIGMKKSRPGTLIRVMCREEEKEKMLRLLFCHTTTIGVREMKTKRYVLDRRIESRETPYGTVRCKISDGYGVVRVKPEYEDLARIAREKNLNLDGVKALLEEV